MSDAKHTPGPWYRDGIQGFPWTVHARQGFEQLGPSVGLVATCEQIDTSLSTRIANARLIAAAPELLAALEDMLGGWRYIRQAHGDLYGVGWDRAQELAEKAIAKAKGES